MSVGNATVPPDCRVCMAVAIALFFSEKLDIFEFRLDVYVA